MRICLGVGLLVASLWLGGCLIKVKIPTFPNRLTLSNVTGARRVHIAYYNRDRRMVPHVLYAVQRALRVTRQWGTLDAPLTIRVFPTHRSLEEAVVRRYHWLRAWALYQDIYLQSPRTWRVRRFRSALQELLVHELTHVAMYQRCCSAKSWRGRDIPFWFREGMASVTARQGRRRWSRERLVLFGRTSTGARVLAAPERHLHRYQPVGYSLAHWLFRELVLQYKKEGVRRILDGMKQGTSFARSFQKVTGDSPAHFRAKYLVKINKLF